MPALIVIDHASAVPPFEQVRTQIVDAIADGSLPVGERLPTVRGLATEIDVAPGTVARAYKELEAAGVVQTRGRHGTFVRAHGDVRTQRIQQAAASFAEEVRAAGGDAADALRLVRAALGL